MKDAFDYIVIIMECQRVKAKNRHQAGLIQPFPITKKKLEVVTIDFITKLSRTARKHDSLMVVVDKLTKVVHFVLVKMTHTVANIA